MKQGTITETKTKTIKTYTFTEEELQHVLDVVFEICVRTYMNQYSLMEREAYGDFVAHHLREAGVDTYKMGVSWGVLK